MSDYHNGINSYLYVIVKVHHGKWLSKFIEGIVYQQSSASHLLMYSLH